MRRMLVALLFLLISAPDQGLAQLAPTPAAASARAALLATADPASAPQIRIETSGHGRAALTGFAIGAVLGAAAGYAFFNAFCEAVDNQCEGSRPLRMVVGGLALGGAGALVGVLLD